MHASSAPSAPIHLCMCTHVYIYTHLYFYIEEIYMHLYFYIEEKKEQPMPSGIMMAASASRSSPGCCSTHMHPACVVRKGQAKAFANRHETLRFMLTRGH